MKNRKRNSLLAFLWSVVFLLAGTPVLAQMNDYKYRRPLGEVAAGWRKIALPTEVAGRVGAGFSDLRILGISAGGDTLEAPYVLRSGARDATPELMPFRIFNLSRNATGYYYTFELAGSRPVNTIILQVDNKNFDWRVQLDGSPDEREWFTLLSDYRVLGIQNAQTDFQFTTLRFPDARYRYLRLLVKANEAPQHLTASLLQADTVEGQYQSYNIAQQSRTEDKKARQTQLDISLSGPSPVGRVQIAVTDTFDYYRPVQIAYLIDSFQTPAGWQYNWSPLFSGTLHSLDRSPLEFEATGVQRLRITIENGDNRPLHLGDVKISGPVYWLLARLDEPANYFLVYGAPRALPPDYDIARFADRIPADAPSVAVGAEETIAHAAAPTGAPLFQNKIWLWVVIVVIALLLGVATLRMMRKG